MIVSEALIVELKATEMVPLLVYELGRSYRNKKNPNIQTPH